MVTRIVCAWDMDFPARKLLIDLNRRTVLALELSR